MSTKPAQVITASRFLLATVWISALSAIPSAQSFQTQLDSGVERAKITTFYNSFSLTVTIATIFAWVVTSRWLRDAIDRTNEVNPGQVKLNRNWAFWSWVVPVVSLWFPRRIMGDLIGNQPKSKDAISLNTWWLTFVGFSLIGNLSAAMVLTSQTPINPINPQYDIAAACLLTASYFVWVQIIALIDGKSSVAASIT